MSSSKTNEPHHYTREETLSKIEDLVEFMQFSVKKDTTFRGSIIWYLTIENDDMIPFSVNLREEDGKLIAESNVGEEAYGDIKVDVSADDFFAIYNGEVGASQLASMILSGRVYVRRFKYKQVSDFASSFDFSSHKWEEFYEMKGIHYPGYEHNDDQDGTKSAEQLDDEFNEIEEVPRNPERMESPVLRTPLNNNYQYMISAYSLGSFSSINMINYIKENLLYSKRKDLYLDHFSSQIRQVLQLSCAESTTSHPLSPLSPTVQETSIEEEKSHTSSSPLSYSLSFPFIRAYKNLMDSIRVDPSTQVKNSVLPQDLAIRNPVFSALYKTIQTNNEAMKDVPNQNSYDLNSDLNNQSFSHSSVPDTSLIDTYDPSERDMSIDINDTSVLDEITNTKNSESSNHMFDQYSSNIYPPTSRDTGETLTIPKIFTGLTQIISTMDGEGFSNNPVITPYVVPYIQIGTLKDRVAQQIKHRILDTNFNPNIMNNIFSYGLPCFIQPDDLNRSKKPITSYPIQYNHSNPTPKSSTDSSSSTKEDQTNLDSLTSFIN